MALIRGNGGLDIRFYVRDPEKAHPWAEPRVLAYYALNPFSALGSSELQEPKKTNTFLVRKVTHARKRNPCTYRDELLHVVGVHDAITSGNFYDCRLWGLSVVGGQILGFSIDLHRRPYNTLALPCECVITKRPSTLTGRNVRLSNLPISSCYLTVCRYQVLLPAMALHQLQEHENIFRQCSGL